MATGTGSARRKLDSGMLELRSAGVALVAGTVVDFAGVTHGKAVPLLRLAEFQECGMGAAPSWNVFCVDNHIAFTSAIGITGDLRLRLDTDGIRCIDA